MTPKQSEEFESVREMVRDLALNVARRSNLRGDDFDDFVQEQFVKIIGSSRISVGNFSPLTL
jgi:DNA-directed RNA polymerase specialized sigma24 family protein